jgi:hypothetical protein
VSSPVTLLDLAGSIALLLWGMHMVQTGRKDEWRDKQSHQHTGTDGDPITLEALIMARIKKE